jgi:O-antigen biosynthesis protein
MTTSATVGCAFWDEHYHISEDPSFWMAHPVCRKAINQRVSGTDDTYPLDYLYAAVGSPRFGKALSLGCGTGRLERSMARLGIAAEIHAVDGSRVSIELATAKAAEEGLTSIHYRQADLNQLRLPRRCYDAVVFHQSLHHVSSVEKLLGRVVLSLKPDGFLFLDEWTGPSRSEWHVRKLVSAQASFAAVPQEWRRWPECRPPIEAEDPSEAVRSSAILPTVHRLFSVLRERSYGGQLVALLLPQIARENVSDTDLDQLLTTWLRAEDQELTADGAAGVYTAVVARPRSGLGLFWGSAVNLGVRALLAFHYRVLPRFTGRTQEPPV